MLTSDFRNEWRQQRRFSQFQHQILTVLFLYSGTILCYFYSCRNQFTQRKTTPKGGVSLLFSKSQPVPEGAAIQWRHELKYPITQGQLEELKLRLSALLPYDSHTGANHQYCIRSLYFDDYYNSCYLDNESGADPREKFRVRIYNGSPERITLELKQKQAGKTRKLASPLPREQLERLLAGEGLAWREEAPPLERKLYLLQETRLMQPKCIVEYDRMPFVCEDGNVRITLDMDIRSGTELRDFLQPRINARPVMPQGIHLLEVKYDEFLPDAIYRTIQSSSLTQTAYSKYYYCRKFGEPL